MLIFLQNGMSLFPAWIGAGGGITSHSKFKMSSVKLYLNEMLLLFPFKHNEERKSKTGIS